MEVEANVPAEQVKIPRVVRHDHGPHLPDAQDDRQVIPFLLQQLEGRTEDATVDDGDVRASVEDQSLTRGSRVSCRTSGRVPVSA